LVRRNQRMVSGMTNISTLYDVGGEGLQSTRFQNYQFSINPAVAGTTYTVLNITGSGILNAMAISRSYGTVYVTITVDGISNTYNNNELVCTDSRSSSEQVIYTFIPFNTSLRIQGRQSGNEYFSMKADVAVHI